MITAPIGMRKIQADSVGTNWRSDVMHAVRVLGEIIEVTDLDGKVIGKVYTFGTGRGHRYYLNDHVSSYKAVWEKMHEWSDHIWKQRQTTHSLISK